MGGGGRLRETELFSTPAFHNRHQPCVVLCDITVLQITSDFKQPNITKRRKPVFVFPIIHQKLPALSSTRHNFIDSFLSESAVCRRDMFMIFLGFESLLSFSAQSIK